MPAVKDVKTPDFQLLVWQIDEDLAFFSKHLKLSHEESQELSFIINENRKLEWLASRYVQRKLIKDSLIKDPFGKPRLANTEGAVSISHCAGYAAAIYSETHIVGLDIEPINPKVLRIIDKFLTLEEQSILSDESVEEVIATWCVKEAVYKWFGKKNLSFKQNIQIQQLSLQTESALVHFHKNEVKESLQLRVERLEDIMISFLAQK